MHARRECAGPALKERLDDSAVIVTLNEKHGLSACRLRLFLLFALGAATVVLLILGTLVLTTFDPCPAGSPAELLPEFCASL